MNTLIKRAAHFAAFVLVLTSAACSMDVAGVEADDSCNRAVRPDGFGSLEVYCTEDLPEDGELDDRWTGGI